MLNIDQVADLLSVHRETVRRKLAAGELRGSKIGQRWRIHPDDLAEFAGRDMVRDLSDAESVSLAVSTLQGKTIELDSRLIRVERQLAAVIAQGAKP